MLSSIPQDLSVDSPRTIRMHWIRPSTSIAAFYSNQRRTRVSWRRFQLCLVVSSNLDCLRQRTRRSISTGSQTHLLESQEINECRDRLHNVVWSFVTTLHDRGTRGTMQEIRTVRMSVSPRRFRKKWSSLHVGTTVEEWVIRECGQFGALPAIRSTHPSRNRRCVALCFMT